MAYIKTTLKKLSDDIDKVLEDNAEANYYNGLFDGGEWSQTGPDFTNLIKRWRLNRRRLNLWTWTAYDYAVQFSEHYPKPIYGYNKYGPYLHNPWHRIWENLTCIFMAGHFQENKFK